MIEITNLTKRFGDKVAVDNITFNVNEGEIMGFLGPNGAGKSTTLNILTGYLSATSGSAKIDGIDVLEDPIGAKRRIGFLPEIPPLYLEMTVKEYLDFAYELKGCRLPRKQHIKEICEVTGAQVDIQDDGSVSILAKNKTALEDVKRRVLSYTAEAEIGKVYRGLVKTVRDFGAFVEILPGQDGLLHISEMANYRVNQVSDICKEGDYITVKVIDIDRSGKIRLSRKAALDEIEK